MKKLLVILFLASPGWATYSVISHVCTGSTDGGNSVTTVGIDTSGADLIVVGMSYLAGVTIGTFSDSKSNSWTQLNSYSGGSGAMTFWYKAAPTVGSAHTFQITGVSNQFPAMCALALSGSAASPFDNQNGAGNASAASLQPGSLTPAESNEIQVTMLGQCAGGSTSAHSINSSFSISDDIALNPGQSCGAGLAYKVKADTTAENPTWSWTGSDGCGANIAGFKAAAAGGATPAAQGKMKRLECMNQL